MMVTHAMQVKGFRFRGDLRSLAGVVITGCLENDASGVTCELRPSVFVAAT